MPIAAFVPYAQDPAWMVVLGAAVILLLGSVLPFWAVYRKAARTDAAR